MSTAKGEASAEDGSMHIVVSGEIDLANAAVGKTRSARRCPINRRRCRSTSPSSAT
jgi:hypothetical protein